jgi:hypothetical protein
VLQDYKIESGSLAQSSLRAPLRRSGCGLASAREGGRAAGVAGEGGGRPAGAEVGQPAGCRSSVGADD